MTSVNEAASNQKPQLASQLDAGLDVLSAKQQITFTLYKKLVLPLDGFVFWVNSSIIVPDTNMPPTTQIVQGSLHYSTELEQDEDASISFNTIVFTAKTPCDIFQEIDPQYLYLANYNGIRFAFNSQGKYYQQADLWHYVGVAVTSIMETQIIDNATQLNSLCLIVSNSLPIWLFMPIYKPPYPGFICPITLYPSFLVPENELPPYGSVHIEDTKSLVETATLGPRLTSQQLSSETVRVTTYGVDNDTIVTFLNFVNQYSYDWGFIGIMNMPIISDLKREQPELLAIAQKKEILFKVSYLQQSVRNVARQHILACIVNSEASKVPPIVVPFVKSRFNAKARIKIAESLHGRS